jgi:hypothetical protein
MKDITCAVRPRQTKMFVFWKPNISAYIMWRAAGIVRAIAGPVGACVWPRPAARARGGVRYRGRARCEERARARGLIGYV